MNVSKAREAGDWLRDVIHWGERIASYLDGRTEAEFSEDTMMQDAVLRCIECIGEASGQIIKAGYADAFPDMEFMEAYWTRNRIAHGYYDVSPGRAWTTTTESIPTLVRKAKRALDERSPQS